MQPVICTSTIFSIGEGPTSGSSADAVSRQRSPTVFVDAGQFAFRKNGNSTTAVRFVASNAVALGPVRERALVCCGKRQQKEPHNNNT